MCFWTVRTRPLRSITILAHPGYHRFFFLNFTEAHHSCISQKILLSTRLMGNHQNQQRPIWGCWTQLTFSPTLSSCSSAGNCPVHDINIRVTSKKALAYMLFITHVSKRFVAERMNLRYFLSLGMIFRGLKNGNLKIKIFLD